MASLTSASQHFTVATHAFVVWVVGRPRNSLVFGGLVLAATRLAYVCYKWRQRNSAIQRKRQQLMRSRMELEQALGDVTPPIEELLHLVDVELSELRARIASQTVKPIDILHAFQAKVLMLHKSGNSCVTDFVAEAENLVLDLPSRHVKQTDRLPLYGIPVSVKESISITGYDASEGLSTQIGKPSLHDCVIVHALKKAGAIPFVITASTRNSIDGTNPIVGDMNNPIVSSHSPGGSSAGEGVLLALGGSRIGLGTDLAGSIRIPAAFCGIVGLKPTALRLSTKGISFTEEMSIFGLPLCVGPMGRRVSDLAHMMHSLLTQSMFRLDRQVPPMAFNSRVYAGEDKARLNIGFYYSLSGSGLVESVPSVRDSVNKAVEILSRAGHIMIAFNPPNPAIAYELGIRGLFADGGHDMCCRLKWEKVSGDSKFLRFYCGLPNWAKRGLALAGRLFVDESLGIFASLVGLRNTAAAIQMLSDIQAYRDSFARAWKDAGNLDALICPVFPFPAPPLSANSMFTSPGMAYPIIYNVLDYPAGVVPIGKVSREQVRRALNEAPLQRSAGHYVTSKILEMQAHSEGLPLSVQVVGLPWQEERVLRVMREIEEGLAKS